MRQGRTILIKKGPGTPPESSPPSAQRSGERGEPEYGASRPECPQEDVLQGPHREIVRSRGSVERDVQGTSVADRPAADHPVARRDTDLQALVRTGHLDIEAGTERTDIPQAHPLPLRGQAGREVEGAQTGRTDAEDALGENPAVKPALGRKVPLSAFGPRLDGIGHVVAQQPPPE